MSTQESRHGDATAVPHDRRGSPRVEVLERLQGELRALEVPVTLLNLSQGGFLMQAPVDFTLHGSHDFRFTAAGQTPIVLRARVIHALRATGGGVGMYVVGLEFEDQGTLAVQDAIEALVGRLQS